MDSGAEEYELNGDLRPGSPGSPDASEPAHQREPLRQQEECGREHAGHCAADGQCLPAEGGHRAGPQLCLLHAAGGPHLHLLGAADRRGCAAHLPCQVRPQQPCQARQAGFPQQPGHGPGVHHCSGEHLHHCLRCPEAWGRRSAPAVGAQMPPSHPAAAARPREPPDP